MTTKKEIKAANEKLDALLRKLGLQNDLEAALVFGCSPQSIRNLRKGKAPSTLLAASMQKSEIIVELKDKLYQKSSKKKLRK